MVLSSLFRISVDLHDVLEIDPKKMVVRVEPCVTIGKLQVTSVQVCDLSERDSLRKLVNYVEGLKKFNLQVPYFLRTLIA
jgi:hypothetical protein